MLKFLMLIRVNHYLKNMLIFFPLIFSGNLTNTEKLIDNTFGFISFCLIASVVYIINDIVDAESDRQHSTKKNRPIASGAVSLNTALISAVLLFLIAIIINYIWNNIFEAWIFLFVYIAINIAYSVLGLKQIPLLEVVILAAGFLLRVLYGSAVTGIPISSWLYLTIIAVSFYLSLGKRRNEIIQESQNNTRQVLNKYSKNFLDKNMYLCLTLAIIFYSFWSIDPETTAHHKNSGAIWTIPLVLLMTMRYNLVIEGDSNGDPVDVILKDKVLLAFGALYIIIMYYIIYGI